MAVRRRKTTRRPVSRKTSSSRRRRSSRQKTLKIKVNPKISREIWAIIYMALGILTILSLQGAFGVIGNVWINFLSPIVGWGVYLVPVVFIMISLFLFFSKKMHLGASRILGFILFMISVLSILHLSVPVDQIYNYASVGQYGGYTGFVVNFLLLEVLKIGTVAASIIFIAGFLVSLVLIFELSLIEMIKSAIPRIKFEASSKKDLDDEKDKEKSPIMIRKALSDKPSTHDGGIIYEDEEGGEEKKFDDKMVINSKVVSDVEEALSKSKEQIEKEKQEIKWEFPSLDLLKTGVSEVHVEDDILMKDAEKIKKKLHQFGINVSINEVNVGPTVIQYTLKPDEGVKLSKITTLKNDLALALAAERIRIEAPIPGKALVGIEIPNTYRATVYLREILESSEFIDKKSKLTLPFGRDVAGKPVVANLENMPHLLVAGATGSGKSVCMNSFLISLLYQNSPQNLRLIMIDPKRVELSCYNNIPHLLSPVIEDPEKAAISLRWVVSEMTRRYRQLSERRVRNISEYNEGKDVSPLPRIIVVVDELADLMMAAGKEVEASICRIAQMARAVGIHLIIATQRPSVDVITGLIKANIPSRISFAVSSSIDSRTILDGIGAEDLLGRGDMLYLPTGMNKPVRVQGIYVSTEEIERVTNRVRLTIEPEYDETITSSEVASRKLNGIPNSSAGQSDDALYEAAFNLVRETRKASASLLQRRLKVGYARAARLIDLLEENGVVTKADGAKPRKILVD